MKKSITTIHPKTKKKNPPTFLVWIQFVLTIALIILGIVTIFKSDLFKWFQLLLGVTITDMGINNHFVYKRPFITPLYIVIGTLIIISFILKILGV